MLRFAEVFKGEEIVYALSRQLSWAHFRSLIYIDDPLKREFFLKMWRSEAWSTRTLRGRLDSMLFERTALSTKPDELLTMELAALREQGAISPNLVLKGPYILDFLGLQDRYLERDLEDTILRELENFLLELGANQKQGRKIDTSQLKVKHLLQGKKNQAGAALAGAIDGPIRHLIDEKPGCGRA